MKIETINKIVESYITAIYFTETGEDGQPAKDIKRSDDIEKYAKQDVQTFIDEAADKDRALIEVIEAHPVQVGIDLWLTRNGHGTGFWDRNDTYGKVRAGQFVDVVEHGYHPERYAYEGDDGLLYLG